MFFYRFLVPAVTWVGLVAATLPTLNTNVEVRNAPGVSSEETLKLIRRSIYAAASKRDSNTKFTGNTTLDQSWDDATLFSKAK